MKHAVAFPEQEIMNDGTIAHDQLRPDSRSVRKQIIQGQARTVFPAFFQIGSTKERTFQFMSGMPAILPYQLPEAGKAHEGSAVPGIDRVFGVALSRQAQHGIGTDGDTSVNHPREMNSEKRQ